MEQNSTPEFRAELLSTPTVNLIPITVGLITLLFQQVLKIEYNGSNPPQFIFSNNFFAFFFNMWPGDALLRNLCPFEPTKIIFMYKT